MTKFYETKEFIKLKKKWDKKLARSGFVDIEFESDDGSISSYMRVAPAYDLGRKLKAAPGKERYFQLASQFWWHMKEHRIGTPRDRKIWGMHADGLVASEIGAKLKVHPSTIHRTVRRLTPAFMDFCRQRARERDEDGAEE